MLIDDITRYVELHRALGFKFRVQENLLRHFSAFATPLGNSHVLTETVLTWAAQAPSRSQRHNRLMVVRRFARHMRAEDDCHEIPPARAFGRPPRRRRLPYIYSPDDVRRLLCAASKLTPLGSIRPATYATMFALIAATGLRISEALALDLRDFMPTGLIIRDTKFRKSRLVPLHDSTRKGMERYLDLRRQVASASQSLFVSLRGTGLCHGTVYAVFLKLMRSLNLRGGPGCSGPCIHDLRHTFAVRALETCSGGDDEVARHVLALSTYLGHAHPSDTYWYLQATPKLMASVAIAGEKLFEGAHE